MDQLVKVMEDLKVQKDSPRVTHCLDAILQLFENEELDRDVTAKSLLEQGLLTDFAHILQSTAHRPKMAQIIAEMAKTEEVRLPCVQEGVVPLLLEMLTMDDMAAGIQACRALGNVCFDNDAGRNAVAEQNGVQTLVNLMRSLLTQTDQGTGKMRAVACGLLLNLTNTHETIQEKAVTLGAMEVLKDYLDRHGSDDSVVQMALCAVGSLTESDSAKEALLSSAVLSSIVNLIGTPVGDDLQETILELLTNLSENDEVKVALARSDLGTRLLGLLQRSQDAPEDDRVQTEKMVSDLVVLVLTGDVSMEVMYGDGDGKIYKESLRWLDSTSEQLNVSAALAIGNFARNDSQCMRLVKDGITEKLLKLLKDKELSEVVEPTLQHAVFSALRNLAIPAVNKPLMLRCGMLEVVLEHIYTEFSSVQFKLLGTVRMAVDGQENAAKMVGTNKDFMEKLVGWCTVEEHAGVKGEANRLAAWLVKHSRSKDVMTLLCKSGGVPHLVHMASSEFAVMQNEALVALTLIASIVLDDASSLLAAADIVPTIKVLLTDKNIASEIICNVLTLSKALSRSAELLQMMKLADLLQIVKDLQKHRESSVAKLAKEIGDILSKG